MANDEISIRIIAFRIEFEPDYDVTESNHPITGVPLTNVKKNGKTKEAHWVDYAPIGTDKLVISEKVNRLRKLGDVNEGQRNPAILIAHHRWTQIEPRYEAWKAGQDPVEDGTPLAAWNGVSPAHIDQLKMRGVYSVEHVAKLTDTAVHNFGIPNLRMIIDNARRFVASLDTEVLADRLAQKDAEIENLTDTVEELKRMVKELAAKPAAAPAPQLKDEDFDDPDFVDPATQPPPSPPAAPEIERAQPARRVGRK